MSETASAGAPQTRLPLRTVIAFSLSAVPVAAMLLMTSTYLPRFFAGHVGISLVAVAATLTLVRLIDIVFDPFIGSVMDGTRTRIGRYRPWMIVGSPLLMIAVYMLFNPPPGADKSYLMIWMLVFYAGYSIFVLAHAAWAAAISTTYHDRSRVYGWMQGVGVLGSSGLLLLPFFTHGRIQPGQAGSMHDIAVILVIAVPIAAGIVTVFSPERVAPAVRRERFKVKDFWEAVSRPAMARIILADLLLTLGPGATAPIFIFFFHEAKAFSVAQVSILLLPYIAAGLIGSPFWAILARRFSKHRTMIASTLCYGVTQTSLMVIPKGLFAATALGMFAVGFCASAFVPLIRAMVADVSDEVRLEQGKERAGLLYAMVTSTQKVGAALAVSIIYPILQAVGFNAADNAVNTPSAIFGLQMCYLFAPVIFVLAGGAMLIGYKLDDKTHAAIRAQLDARDAKARLAGAPGEAPAGPIGAISPAASTKIS